MHGKPSQLHHVLSSKAKQYERVVGHGLCSYSLLAVNSAVNKEGWLCTGAANSNVHTYVFPLDDVIANNCMGEKGIRHLKWD